jgi:hypothetical protein
MRAMTPATKLPAHAEPDSKHILQYPYMLMGIRAASVLHIVPTSNAYESPAYGAYAEKSRIVEYSPERRPVCRECRKIMESKGCPPMS